MMIVVEGFGRWFAAKVADYGPLGAMYEVTELDVEEPRVLTISVVSADQISEMVVVALTEPPPTTSPDPGPVILPAGVFFDRTTEVEADAIDEAMMAQPVKFRRAWAAATAFRSDNDLWPVLRAAIADLYGETRADELMAAPNAEMMMAPVA